MCEDRVDEIARRAGTALRRPAPADGLANVRSSHRRRRTARVAAGGAAVALAAVGAFMVVDRGDDDSTVVTESTTVTTTTTPSTTTTTPSTTTLPPAVESGWQRADGAFPQLAFAACCGLNWEEGEPSPAVPADPDDPLSPGMYNVRSVFDDQAVDDYADGRLALELRPFTRCDELAEFECFDPPFTDNELGVPNTAARTIEVALDDSVRVGLHGFRCVDGQLELETWLGDRRRPGDVDVRARRGVRDRRRRTSARRRQPGAGRRRPGGEPDRRVLRPRLPGLHRLRLDVAGWPDGHQPRCTCRRRTRRSRRRGSCRPRRSPSTSRAW